MQRGASISVIDPRSERSLEGCSPLLHLRTCRQKMFMVMASHAQRARKGRQASKVAVTGLLASQHAWEEFGSTCDAGISHDADLGSFLKSLESVGVAEICAIGNLSTSDPLPEHLDPHLICFERCVLEAARRLAPAPARETVCFIMDWVDPLAPAALWRLEDLTNFSPSPLRERLGAMGFEHGETFLPLRVARWLSKQNVERTYPPGPRVVSGEFH